MLTQLRLVSFCSTVYKLIARFTKEADQIVHSLLSAVKSSGVHQGTSALRKYYSCFRTSVDFHKIGPVTHGCLQIDLTKAFDSLIASSC